MKFAHSFLFALASIHSAFANKVTCKADSELLNGAIGQVYSPELVVVSTPASDVRVAHEDDVLTADVHEERLTIITDDSNHILNVGCY
ncbi:hypothetical protein ASPWEDRAFT_186163 [Aspergillus wentii DTO 134E9]|uniref:Uncharacterized protein n=1 Tax=Aspergillus wentii DTO 134E9 TaxID=1073089 RepID=A0A1L9RAH5_ASPWE|nr:uncharacterized protein ASPWEDRAFT_186163 [Aspergillus wentii DTO 134E9]KAI9934507.1 hypothetical protein MW887_000121 [Aspergillus wentii]OJJ31922.1 hypothetical protein ASPWEDRAFT_186163 [Aspergillus wentii DTO 134E9]